MLSSEMRRIRRKSAIDSVETNSMLNCFIAKHSAVNYPSEAVNHLAELLLQLLRMFAPTQSRASIKQSSEDASSLSSV